MKRFANTSTYFEPVFRITLGQEGTGVTKMEELTDYDGTAKALPVIRQKPKIDKKPDRASLVSSHIKKRHKRILVVDDEKLKRSCVDSIMFKPFGLEDLRKTVQGMIDQKALD